MTQIGWFEILVIVDLAILVIGPIDFPIVVKKIGYWVGSVKRYFSEIQEDVASLESAVEDEISLKDEFSVKQDKKNKNE